MKLRTRLLIFSSVFLLVLPWLGYQFIQKIEQSLLQGQEEAQLMVASAIATLLNGYSGLFAIDEDALYVYPLKGLIDVDGYAEDWQPLLQGMSHYRSEEGLPAFSLLLADDREYLYAYLRVKDEDIVYRHPRYRPLDASDHVRLQYLDAHEQRRRLVITTEAQGRASVYEVQADWRQWKSGRNISAVTAWWRETGEGYDLELRLPRDWLEPNRRLALSVVSVFGDNERYIEAMASTRGAVPDALNPLLFQSPEISSILQNLGDAESRICVVDRYRRVRTVTGGVAGAGGRKVLPRLCRNVARVDAQLVARALQGEAQVSHLQQQGESLIVAAWPVLGKRPGGIAGHDHDHDAVDIVGAVLVSKNSERILARQRGTLIEVALASLGLFLLALFSLLGFSSWLAFRINRLQKEAAGLIDDSGRFIRRADFSDSRRQDEIGELARSFSRLLERLDSYTRFLESVPRMLRHEILNPVNTISLSLQQQRQQPSGTHLDTAENGIRQLQLIVSGLTEAASIDEALRQDDMESLDIAALLVEYVSNSQRKHPQAQLCYAGRESGVYVLANDIRMVQLLDKIKDNALDFARPGTPICFQLDVNHGGEVEIQIKNEGKSIAEDQLALLFQGMISQRREKTGQPHLGIGLYVAHRISRFHQGELQIANRDDGQGVVVSLRLALAGSDRQNDKRETT